jgi:hypothetical protein
MKPPTLSPGRQLSLSVVIKTARTVLSFALVIITICPLLCKADGPVSAAPDTLDLALDDPAVIRWDITDIAPGDSGIEPINLYNNGDIPGYLYIWIDNVVDSEGDNPESETGNTAEPGELSSRVTLDIVNPGLTFGVLTDTGYTPYDDLPVTLADFPHAVNRALFILGTEINPGETLVLQWQWLLPVGTDNDAQGDAITFNFNYMLSTFYPGQDEPPGPAEIQPVYYPPTVTTPPTPPVTTTPTVTPTPALPARTYTSEDGLCVIYIRSGLRVYTDSDGELTDIVIEVSTDAPPAPDFYDFAGEAYRIYSYTAEGKSEDTGLHQEVQLTIYFDPGVIPEGGVAYLAIYHPEKGWIRQEAVGGATKGRLSAMVDYLGTVAVIYETNVPGDDLIPIETVTPIPLDNGEPSHLKEIIILVGVGIAAIGTVTATTVTIIRDVRDLRERKHA